MKDLDLDHAERVSLCEALDRVLNKGAVVLGEVTISVANVDLIYLGLQLVLTSVETCHSMRASASGQNTDGLTPAWSDSRSSSQRHAPDVLGDARGALKRPLNH